MTIRTDTIDHRRRPAPIDEVEQQAERSSSPATAREESALALQQTAVESFSGTVVSTIEGNADDQVRGRTYDLSNPDDVAKVVFLARPGIEPAARAETEEAAETAADEVPAADSTAVTSISPGDLLGPLQTLNALLQRLGTVVGGVAPTSTPSQTVADLSPEGDSGRAN